MVVNAHKTYIPTMYAYGTNNSVNGYRCDFHLGMWAADTAQFLASSDHSKVSALASHSDWHSMAVYPLFLTGWDNGCSANVIKNKPPNLYDICFQANNVSSTFNAYPGSYRMDASFRFAQWVSVGGFTSLGRPTAEPPTDVTAPFHVQSPYTALNRFVNQHSAQLWFSGAHWVITFTGTDKYYYRFSPNGSYLANDYFYSDISTSAGRRNVSAAYSGYVQMIYGYVSAVPQFGEPGTYVMTYDITV